MSAQYSAPLGTGTPWPIWVIGAVLVTTLTVVAWERHDSGGVIAQDLPAVVRTRSRSSIASPSINSARPGAIASQKASRTRWSGWRCR